MLKFEVLFIKNTPIVETLKSSINNDFGVNEYKEVQNYHFFKILNEYNHSEKGVEKLNHEIVNTDDFLKQYDGNRIVSVGFVIVNKTNGNVYIYNYSKKKLKELLIKYFHINNFDTIVDKDKLSKITKIEIKLTANNQQNFFYDNLQPETNLKKELDLQDSCIEKITTKYELNPKGVLVSKRKLSSILSRYPNIYIDGFDDSDNIIKIRDAVSLIIEIEAGCTSFEDIFNLSYKNIVDLISEKERGALNGY